MKSPLRHLRLVVVCAAMTISLPLFAAEAATCQEKVNINKADVAAFEALPYIGHKTAESIIDYRQKNGNFKSINDFAMVKGVGEKRAEKLKNCLSL